MKLFSVKKLYFKNKILIFQTSLGEDDCLQSLFSTFEDSTESYIVIREASRLRIYSEKGEEFFVHLPIPLKTMWKSAYGLILEGKILDSDHPDMLTPKLLVLQHPLDDFTRVVSKQNKSLVEWKNNRHQLLMVCENPSLAGKLKYNISSP